MLVGSYQNLKTRKAWGEDLFKRAPLSVIFFEYFNLKRRALYKDKGEWSNIWIFVNQMVVYGQMYQMTKFKANLLVNLLTI